MELRVLFTYFLTVPFVVALDLLWLGLFAQDFYRSSIGHLLSGEINWAAAAAFYIIFTLGLFYFAIYQGFTRQSLLIAIFSGMLFGFFAYATYDLTNMATLKDWPLMLTLIDIAWGTVMSGIVAAIGFSINKIVIG